MLSRHTTPSPPPGAVCPWPAAVSAAMNLSIWTPRPVVFVSIATTSTAHWATSCTASASRRGRHTCWPSLGRAAARAPGPRSSAYRTYGPNAATTWRTGRVRACVIVDTCGKTLTGRPPPSQTTRPKQKRRKRTDRIRSPLW